MTKAPDYFMGIVLEVFGYLLWTSILRDTFIAYGQFWSLTLIANNGPLDVSTVVRPTKRKNLPTF